MQRTNDQQCSVDKWRDIKIAASHTGTSVPFLRKLVREKKIPFVRIGGKLLRFRLRDLDRWLEANGYGEDYPQQKGRPASHR